MDFWSVNLISENHSIENGPKYQNYMIISVQMKTTKYQKKSSMYREGKLIYSFTFMENYPTICNV